MGAKRFQFPEKQVALITRILGVLPDFLRTSHGGHIKSGFAPPAEEAVKQDDPSESVSSAEIVPLMARHFVSVESRPYGNNLAQFLFSGILHNFEQHAWAIRLILEMDRMSYESGYLTSDFLWAVYRQRPL